MSTIKSFLGLVVVAIFFALFAVKAQACAGTTCSGSGGSNTGNNQHQNQQQAQGGSFVSDNSNQVTNAPVAAMSAIQNVYTGEMAYQANGISCPSTQLYGGIGAGTTRFNPSGASADTLQGNVGIAIPLDSGTCEELMEFQRQGAERFEGEQLVKFCYTLFNDGLGELVFDNKFIQDVPMSAKCQTQISFMLQNPDRFQPLYAQRQQQSVAKQNQMNYLKEQPFKK